MIHYRKADWPDVEPLLDLIEKGFSIKQNAVDHLEGKAHRVLFSYLYAQENWKPEWVYLAEENSRLIAAVGVFPQELSFGGHWLPVWAVSPVVTNPQYRSRGTAAACLREMFNDLKSKGIYAAFLWGIPSYYPRFGFVPVLPRYKSKIIGSQFSGSSGADAGIFRAARSGDGEILQELYSQNETAGWLKPRRDVRWWEKRLLELDSENAFLKEVPFLKKENFKIWENSSGKVNGYLNLEPIPEKKQVFITEGATVDLATARAMLANLLAQMAPQDTLMIRGTPDHYLNSVAYTGGGTHINPAPLAGMIKILDWRRFFHDLAPVFRERLKIMNVDGEKFQLRFSMNHDQVVFDITPDGLEIRQSHEELFSLEFNAGLTRLVMGIYNEDDLQYLSGNDKERYLSRLFPQKYPFIWDANYLY